MARLILLLLFLSPITFYAQHIEAINSNEEALAFVKKVQPGFEEKPPYAEFRQHTRDSLFPVLKRIKYYEKADFDNNGYTDLLFNGCAGCRYSNKYDVSPPWVILSFGNDSFQVKDLSCEKYQIYAAGRTVQSAGRPPMIEIAYAGGEDDAKGLTHEIKGVDTLIYAVGDFIENTQPAHHNIEKISFTCLAYHFYSPRSDSLSFELTLSPDSSSLIREVNIFIDKNNPITTYIRKYVAGGDTACFSRLANMLNQINFPRLKKYYGAGSVHEGLGLLSVTYDNGKVIHIRDRAMLGTYALRAIYNSCYKKAALFVGPMVSNEQGWLTAPW